MIKRKEQKGLTTVSWMLILGMVAFFIMMGLKLAPLYLENFTVNESLNGLQDMQTRDMTALDILDYIDRQFQVNRVKEIDPRSVAISRDGDYYIVSADYEVRRSLVGNIDLLVRFEHTVEVPAP